jgi:hypothetical protein
MISYVGLTSFINDISITVIPATNEEGYRFEFRGKDDEVFTMDLRCLRDFLACTEDILEVIDEQN